MDSHTNTLKPNIEKLDTFSKVDFRKEPKVGTNKQYLQNKKFTVFALVLLGFIFLSCHQFYTMEVYKKKKENVFF